MSVVEQLVFAVLGVSILAATLALSDPKLRIAVAPKSELANEYALQSCPHP